MLGRIDQPDPTQASTKGRVRWFGPFADQAEANDLGQLAFAIEDFIARFGLDREHHLLIDPVGRRMFSVRLEPPPAGSIAVALRIPVGTDRRRAGLADIGWAIERATSGARYHTRRFTGSDVAPETVARAIFEGYEKVYGDRAKDLRWLVRVVRVAADESDIGRTERHRRPRSRTDAILAVGASLLCSWAIFQSSANSSGWLLAPWLVVAVIVGGLACAVGLSLTDAPERLARPNAEFWGGGRATRGIVIAALCGCASLAWGMALILLFGTRPGGH